MKLQTKVVTFSVVGVLLTASVTIGLVVINKARLGEQIRSEINVLGQESCRHVALDVRRMLEVYHQALINSLNRGMKAVEETVARYGDSRSAMRKSHGRPLIN